MTGSAKELSFTQTSWQVVLETYKIFTKLPLSLPLHTPPESLPRLSIYISAVHWLCLVSTAIPDFSALRNSCSKTALVARAGAGMQCQRGLEEGMLLSDRPPTLPGPLTQHQGSQAPVDEKLYEGTAN